jgi:hypothetical protein
MKRIVIHIDRIALHGVPGIAKIDVERAIAAHLSVQPVERAPNASHAKPVRGAVATRIGAAVARAVQRSSSR